MSPEALEFAAADRHAKLLEQVIREAGMTLRRLTSDVVPIVQVSLVRACLHRVRTLADEGLKE